MKCVNESRTINNVVWAMDWAWSTRRISRKLQSFEKEDVVLIDQSNIVAEQHHLWTGWRRNQWTGWSRVAEVLVKSVEQSQAQIIMVSNEVFSVVPSP